MKKEHRNKYLGFTLNRNGLGFTLIELLVSIAIIGILATIVAINLIDSPKKARDAKRTVDVDSIKTALGVYFEDYGSYPQCKDGSAITVDGIECRLANDYSVTGNTEKMPAIKPYIASLPKDPKENVGYQYTRINPTSYKIRIGYEKKDPCITGINVPENLDPPISICK